MNHDKFMNTAISQIQFFAHMQILKNISISKAPNKNHLDRNFPSTTSKFPLRNVTQREFFDEHDRFMHRCYS